MGKDFTFEELIERLQTGDSSTRKEAAKALGKLKDLSMSLTCFL